MNVIEPVYEKTFPVRSYEVDEFARMRPTALLNYLQEAAGDHARLLGIAVRDLMARGLTWVISRMHVSLFGTACSREEVRVRTWPSSREGRFSCREFEVMGGDGRLIALATSSFAVLDLATRRPVVIQDRVPPYPLLERRAIDDPFATLPRLAEFDNELAFRVGRAELDVNRHANNVWFASWALETVPSTIAEGYFLSDIEIAFRAETLYGETVLARCRQAAGGTEPVFIHQLVRAGDGTELTRLVTRWRELDQQTVSRGRR